MEKALFISEILYPAYDLLFLFDNIICYLIFTLNVL